jgi:hypothetical protein
MLLTEIYFLLEKHSSHSEAESTSVVRDTPKSTLNRVPPSIAEETPEEAKSSKQMIGEVKISPEVGAARPQLDFVQNNDTVVASFKAEKFDMNV